MELTYIGRSFLSLGSALLMVGVFFSSPIILVPAVILFLYVLSQGIAFRRAVHGFQSSARIETSPSSVETNVGQPINLETLVTNPSTAQFRIIKLDYDTPATFLETAQPAQQPALPPRGEQIIPIRIIAKIPGKFELTASRILLEEPRRLFRHTVQISTKFRLIARPLTTGSARPIETDALYALSIDEFRKGPGTDFAGIKPFSFLDDFHRIDWKATARTGRLMTRETYLERDPAILLMIDLSSPMRTPEPEISNLNQMISEIEKILSSIRATSPVGSIMYDERTVIAYLEPAFGLEVRKRILNVLLEASKIAPPGKTSSATVALPGRHRAADTELLAGQLASPSEAGPHWNRFQHLAKAVLPYYRQARSRFHETVRRKGVFKAFVTISDLYECVVAIVITGAQSDLDGLLEGAKRGAKVRRAVIAAILDLPVAAHPEMSRNLEAFGISLVKSTAGDLANAINFKMEELGRLRSFPVALG